MAHRDAVFEAQRTRILAAEIAVPNIEFQIVHGVIGEIHLVPEPGLDVEGLRQCEDAAGLEQRADGPRRVITPFDAANTLQRPSAVVPLGFWPDMPLANAAELTPIGVRAIDTEQTLVRITREQVAADIVEEAVVEARARGVDLRAEVAAERRRHRGRCAIEILPVVGAAKSGTFGVDAVDGRNAAL